MRFTKYNSMDVHLHFQKKRVIGAGKCWNFFGLRFNNLLKADFSGTQPGWFPHIS